MKKDKHILSGFIALVMLFSFCFSFSVSADVTEDVVLNYLSNWSYVDGDCIYRINSNALTEGQILTFVGADADTWNSLAMDLVADAFYNYQPTEEISPYAAETSGWISQTLSFTYGGDTQTRSFKYKIFANITTTNGETSVSGETCSVSIPGTESMSYNSLSHVYTVDAGTHIAIGFSACFTAEFTPAILVDKWASMTHNFDI